MAELKFFTFWVRNETTKESPQFKGQGRTLAEAWKDGHENAVAQFRPSSSGAGATSTARFAVTLPDGRRVLRDPKAFEGDEPHKEGES